MTPLGGQPGVVEIQPADLRTDRECGLYRVKLMTGARHARTTRQRRSRYQWTEVLHAFRELHGQHRGAQRVEQHVARSVVGFLGVDLVIGDVVGDVYQRLVRIGTYGGTDVVRTHGKSRNRETPILADWHARQHPRADTVARTGNA